MGGFNPDYSHIFILLPQDQAAWERILNEGPQRPAGARSLCLSLTHSLTHTHTHISLHTQVLFLHRPALNTPTKGFGSAIALERWDPPHTEPPALLVGFYGTHTLCQKHRNIYK